MSLNKLSGLLSMESGFNGKTFIYNDGHHFFLSENIKNLILEKDDVFGVWVGGEFLYYESPIIIYYEDIKNNLITGVKKIIIYDDYNELVIEL